MNVDLIWYKRFWIVTLYLVASTLANKHFRGNPTNQKEKHFTCFNGLRIDESKLCNGLDDCNDGFMSDECDCEVQQETAPRLICNKSRRLEKHIGDKIETGDEDSPCEHNIQVHQTDGNEATRRESCYKCINGENEVSASQVCNGVLDCNDFSDECLCDEVKTPGICNIMYDPTVEVSTECLNTTGDVPCGNGTCIARSSVCNGIQDCLNGLDERYCAYEKESVDLGVHTEILCDVTNVTTGKVEQTRVTACDGIPECDNREDECIELCRIKGQELPNFCSKDLDCMLGSQICDGVWNSDKIGKCGNIRIQSEERECPKRFYCGGNDKISVDISKVCDGKSDCEDQSDESIERNCNDSRFYCENKEPLSSYSEGRPGLFVWKSQLFDGKADCQDGSDECPTEVRNTNSFNSHTEMIAFTFLRVVLWINAIIACVGNFASLVATIRSLLKKKDLPTVSICNHYLIINLSAADLLMGIYMFAISIQGTRFSGNYCMEDKRWRSSATCTALGVLVVLSSEMSVIVMVIMAAFRLHSVFKPFFTINNPSVEKVLRFLLLSGWVVSILFAIMPAIGPLRHYFVTEAFIRNAIFSNDQVEFKIVSDTAKLIMVSSHRGYIPNGTDVVDVRSTKNIEKIYKSVFPQKHILGWFDIYSQNSGCLPRLFVNTTDKAWEYSLSLVVFNFLAFCLLVLFYGFIIRINYLNEKKMASVRARNSQSVPKCKLEKCITRLLITDFLCWIPICIIAFVYLGGIHVPSAVYAVTGFILLPINSALNPLLYSASLRAILSSFNAEPKDNKTQSTSATSV